MHLFRHFFVLRAVLCACCLCFAFLCLFASCDRTFSTPQRFQPTQIAAGEKAVEVTHCEKMQRSMVLALVDLMAASVAMLAPLCLTALLQLSASPSADVRAPPISPKQHGRTWLGLKNEKKQRQAAV